MAAPPGMTGTRRSCRVREKKGGNKKSRDEMSLLLCTANRASADPFSADASAWFCRSSDCNVQALSRQRAEPAFSPPRYRTSMTRFRDAPLGAGPALRFHSYKSGRGPDPCPGFSPDSLVQQRTRMRVRRERRVAHLPQKPKCMRL